jgi:arylsulfatase A
LTSVRIAPPRQTGYTMPMHLLRLFTLLAYTAACAVAADRPNLVFILADDLGVGDVRALNPEGKIATPNLDRLAREGMAFTDAHSGSAVCTPTRYGVLTGRYAWRSRLKQGVLGGLSPRLIEPGRATVASFLKERGYATACVGKWHLGLDWAKKPGKAVNELGIERDEQNWSVDFTQPFANGPLTLGFDHFFGISASLDMVPYTWLRDDRVTEVPDHDGSFPWFHGREKRTRKGPAAKGFDAADVLPTLGKHAAEWIAGVPADKPFFLYLPFASPHTPVVPTPDWLGKSGISPYADFVMQTDAEVGRVLKALEDAGRAANTLVIFTSDNGCSPEADYPQLATAGHNPSGLWRGHKADIFEGGHRVPFLARWPGRVAPGTTHDGHVCLTDLFATAAEITGAPFPDNAGATTSCTIPSTAPSPSARASGNSPSAPTPAGGATPNPER